MNILLYHVANLPGESIGSELTLFALVKAHFVCGTQ